MQDICYQAIDQTLLTTKKTLSGTKHVLKIITIIRFDDKRCFKRIPMFYNYKVRFGDTLSTRTYFWDTAVACGSENSHNVVQLKPNEDKYYLSLHTLFLWHQ